jgi:hypothetical protein
MRPKVVLPPPIFSSLFNLDNITKYFSKIKNISNIKIEINYNKQELFIFIYIENKNDLYDLLNAINYFKNEIVPISVNCHFYLLDKEDKIFKFEI